METNTANVDEIFPEPERPSFLSALCILTWIMSGLMLLISLNSVFNKPSPEKQAEQIEKIREANPKMAEQMEIMFEQQNDSDMIANTLLGIVGVVFSVLGAIMMWQLKKKGFFLYLAGELLPYIGILIAGSKTLGPVAAMMGMSESTAVGIVIGFMAFFDAIFITLYAVNFKHLKH